jgi:uncharacterized membrane protein YwaF
VSGGYVMDFFTTSDLLGRSGPFNKVIDYTIFYLLLAVLTVGLIWFLRKKGTSKTVKYTLIACWGLAVFVDVAKIIVSVSTGGFQLTGSLPLYICSIFMYAMPFAIWGKGKLKDIGCTYVCTIGLFGAFMNYIIPSVTINHSLLSFYGLHTTIYHSMLLVAPIVMLTTGYTKLSFKNFGWTFLGFVGLTAGVVVLDYIIEADYMYFRTAETTSVGIVMNIASATSYFWPVLMYLGYAIVQTVMTGLIIGVNEACCAISKAIDNASLRLSNNTNNEKETKEDTAK